MIDPADPAVPPDLTLTPPTGVIAARPIPAERPHVEPNPPGKRRAILTITALGVVYGDIGTSPLYAFRECFKPEYGIAPTSDNVYGVLSLIVWSLTLVVSDNSMLFDMRAHTRREAVLL